MVKKIYYAIGIYKGGGLTILKEFLKKKKTKYFILIVDLILFSIKK